MINSIQLKNFQCHSELAIQFTNGVNVLVGSSENGKSAVMRALSLVLWNSISGNSYVKHGTKSASVTVDIDGHVIERTRKGISNTYTVDGTVLKAIGMAPLDAVTDIHRMDREICFQGQHDSAFMLSWKSTDLFQTLNAIVDMEVVDKAVSAAKQDYKSVSEEVVSLEKNLTSWKTQCEGLSNVPKQIEIVNSVLDQYSKSVNIGLECDSITQKVLFLQEIVEELEEAEKKEKSLQYIVSSMKDARRLRKLLDARHNILVIEHHIVELGAKERALQAITELCKSIVLIQRNKNILQGKIEKVEASESDIEAVKVEMQKHMQIGKRFHGFCPTCGREGFLI